MRKSCTEKKRRAKKGRIWKREKGLVRQHVGRKQKGKNPGSQKERETQRGRGRQRTQRGRCVKEK